jgi:hypothetical protein
MKTAALSLTLAGLLLAAAGSTPLQPAAARAADDVLLPFSPPKFSAPTAIRIGSARFLVSATIIRSFPGNVPDPSVAFSPPTNDSLLIRVEQVGSRNGPIIFSASAAVTPFNAAPVAVPLSRGSDGRVIQFYSSSLPAGTIPGITDKFSLNVRSTITLNTNRGRRSITIPNLPISIIAYPEAALR